MARPKKIEDGESVSIVLSKKQLDHVRLMAIRMSGSEGRVITVSKAIRLAVEAAYPVPKNQQMDMFSR